MKLWYPSASIDFRVVQTLEVVRLDVQLVDASRRGDFGVRIDVRTSASAPRYGMWPMRDREVSGRVISRKPMLRTIETPFHLRIPRVCYGDCLLLFFEMLVGSTFRPTVGIASRPCHIARARTAGSWRKLQKPRPIGMDRVIENTSGIT